jgi:hypothetical protein
MGSARLRGFVFVMEKRAPKEPKIIPRFEQKLGLLRFPAFEVHEDEEGTIETAPVHMDTGHDIDNNREQGDIDYLAQLLDNCIGSLMEILR